MSSQPPSSTYWFVCAPASRLGRSELASARVSFGPVFFPFFNFWPYPIPCGTLDPCPGISPGPPAMEAQSPNRWAPRGVSWPCLQKHVLMQVSAHGRIQYRQANSEVLSMSSLYFLGKILRQNKCVQFKIHKKNLKFSHMRLSQAFHFTNDLGLCLRRCLRRPGQRIQGHLHASPLLIL